jgi:hypothetical protein
MTSIIDLRFVFFFLLSTSFRDIWNMSKTELPSWGYNPEHKGVYIPSASEASSIGQFVLMYFYVAIASLVLYNLGYYIWQIALCNILAIGWLHWTGSEDLGYYAFEIILRHPKEYETTHAYYNICGFHIPKLLPWLARTRKLWFIKIPSIMKVFCGVEIEGKKFVAFALLNIIIIVALAYFIKI